MSAHGEKIVNVVVDALWPGIAHSSARDIAVTTGTRAILELLDATREPSEAMLDAAARRNFEPYRTPYDAIWVAMVDSLKREITE